MADGSITFSTKLDNAELEQELTRLGKKILRLEDDLKTKKYKRSALYESLKQAREELAKLQGQTTMNVADGKFQMPPESVDKITELQEKIPQMEDELKKYDDALKDVNQTLEATAQRYVEIADRAELLRKKQAEESYKNSVEGLNEELDSLLRKQKELNSYGLGLGLGKEKRAEISAELSETNQRIDEIKRKLAETASNSERAGDGLRKSAKNANELADATKRADGFLDKFTKRIAGLLKRVFIFSLITTALRSARTWMGKVIKTNSEATASIARLKGALLTLAQPLLEVIIPAFTMLVKVLTAIIGAIAQFVSLLAGKSVKQTAASAKALYDEQRALEGVGSAAEEAKGSLAGFDEINTIQTEDTGGGGGGAGSGLEVEPDFSWMDAISERLKEIADLVMLIGLGFALWKIGQMIPGVLGKIFTLLGGILMTIGGLLLFWNGLMDAWENGVDWLNLIEMVGGLAAAAFGLYTVFSVLAPALAPIVTGIVLVVGGIAMLVAAFHDAMENGWNLQNTLLAIAGIVATGLGFAFITGSVIPLVIAGIAALLLAMTVATGHGEELLTGIRTMLEGFADFFTEIFSGDIEKAIGGITKIFDGLGIAVEAVIDGVRDTILSFLDWLDEKTGGKLHGIIEAAKEYVTGFFSNTKATIIGWIDGVKQMFMGFLQFCSGDFAGGIKNIFAGMLNANISLLEGSINQIISGINWLISQLNKIHFELPDWVPAIGGKSFLGFNIQPLGKVSIPRLAQGAVIPPNREFLAVLGDQKSGTNIETPLSTMKQAFLEAMQENGGMGGGDIHITVDLDGRVLARQTVKHINDMTRQAGKPVLLY